MSAPLSRSRVLAFALPSLVSGILERPALYVLPFVYSKYFGLDLATVGAVLFLARTVDVATDPLVGHLSDNTRSRFGRRKPWLIPGALLTGVSVWLLFVPPPLVSAAYFALWYCALYVGWTMLEIPMSSWMAELAHDYPSRSRLVASRTAFSQAGALLFALLPLTPVLWPGLGVLESTEIDPAALRAIAVLIVIVLPVAIAWTLLVVPQGQALDRSIARGSLLETVRAAIANRPARLFAVSFALTGVGTGLLHAVYFFWVDGYLGMGALLPWILVIISLTGVVGVVLWHQVIQRWQRHRAWAVGGTLAAIPLFSMPFIGPGPGGFALLCAASAGYGVLIAATYVAAPAVLADLIDYDAMRTGRSRAGSYFALMFLTQKLTIACGGALAFWILDVAGYRADASTQTANAHFGLMLALCYLPGVLYAGAAAVMWFFPLGRRRQAIVRRRLERRVFAQQP